jgi:hypothetical protein
MLWGKAHQKARTEANPGQFSLKLDRTQMPRSDQRSEPCETHAVP